MSKSPLISILALILLSGGPVLADPAAPPEPAPAAAIAADSPPSDLAKQLADVQDKLSTALHSYELLQDENNQLKAAAQSAGADKAAQAAQLQAAVSTVESLQAQAAVGTQVAGLRDQLRQSENEIAALAEENAQLKTRLALAGPVPGSSALAPTRPGAESPPPMASPAPMPAPSIAGSAPAAGKGSAKTPTAGSTAAAASVPAEGTSAPAAAVGPRIYVVVAGDTLGKISRQFYGTAAQYEKIAAANREVIRDENNLQVGMKLKIP